MKLKVRKYYGNESVKASNHYCHDETATVVNGRWLCNCPGRRCAAVEAQNHEDIDDGLTDDEK
jgi:hypothetical protein